MSRQEFRIASYNIRKARGLDQRRDPGRVLDVINALEADIVVLQEADLRLGRRRAAIPHRMIDEHSDYDLAPLAKREESLGWHGNAVLARSEINVSSIRHIDLPGLEPRGAAILALTGHTDVTLVATHLGLRRSDRQDQQHAIRAALLDAPNAIVAGDFNEWSSNKGLELFEQDMRVHAPGRSFPTRLPMARLDRFAIAKGLDVVASGVERGEKARKASDHLPVWCAVRKAKPPASDA